MGLRIRKLDTACQVPRRYRNQASVVDQFARGRLALDLAGHLGPSLSRLPAIVRIRHLPIRVIVPPSDLNEGSLSKAWTAAFSRALFTALAYPTGAGPVEVFRADSVERFLAEVIRDLLDGTAAGKWQYAEFQELFRSGVNAASISLLTNWPHVTFPILMELDQLGALDKLLPRLEDLAFERLFVTLAAPADLSPPPLLLADLIAVAKLILRHPPQKAASLRTRAYALRLYLYARRKKEPLPSPRPVFHTLFALALLLSDDFQLLSSVLQGESTAKNIPSATVALLQAFAHQVRSTPESPRLSEFQQLLSTLRSALNVPSPSDVASEEARSISSDWCGLFFLVGTLHRLGWIPAWSKLAEFQSGGISPLLAGLALSITGTLESDIETLDPGLALFAGYFSEPDLSHIRKIFNDFHMDLPQNVLNAAIKNDKTSVTWPGALHELAERLLRAFASGIRGFQRSSPQGVVRTFLARKGRIRIEDERILVQPEPSPFHVALHIAGMDANISSVSWLGRRRLEFEIGEI